MTGNVPSVTDIIDSILKYPEHLHWDKQDFDKFKKLTTTEQIEVLSEVLRGRNDCWDRSKLATFPKWRVPEKFSDKPGYQKGVDVLINKEEQRPTREDSAEGSPLSLIIDTSGMSYGSSPVETYILNKKPPNG